LAWMPKVNASGRVALGASLFLVEPLMRGSGGPTIRGRKKKASAWTFIPVRMLWVHFEGAEVKFPFAGVWNLAVGIRSVGREIHRRSGSIGGTVPSGEVRPRGMETNFIVLRGNQLNDSSSPDLRISPNEGP